MYGVNDWAFLWAVPTLGERIRLAVLGHLERRGHITHIKGGRESGSLCLAMGWWRELRVVGGQVQESLGVKEMNRLRDGKRHGWEKQRNSEENVMGRFVVFKISVNI